MDVLEEVILVIQVLILVVQVYFAWYLYKKSNESEKGFFVIKETNIPHIGNVKNTPYMDIFDLKEPIVFKLVGGANAFIINSKVEVNGHVIENESIPYETIYTLNERFNTLSEDSLLKMNLLEDKIIMKIDYFLKNEKGYKYIEKIYMEFTKCKDNNERWALTQYNITFKNKKF